MFERGGSPMLPTWSVLVEDEEDQSVGDSHSSSQSMMDELLTPSPAKKRKLTAFENTTPAKQGKARKSQVSGAANTQTLQLKKPSTLRETSTSTTISAKPKSTQAKARATQENAIAGPSIPRKPAATSQTPTRISTRVSRPTLKKAALKRRHYTDSESDSDSDKTPPPSILPRHYAAKKRKLAKAKSQAEKDKAPASKVSLGAIELSSDSEEDIRSKPPRKRPKINHDFSKQTGVIDLCSDEDQAPSPKKPKTTLAGDIIVILSSSDEGDPGKPSTQPPSPPPSPPIQPDARQSLQPELLFQVPPGTTSPPSPAPLPTANPEATPESRKSVDIQEPDLTEPDLTVDEPQPVGPLPVWSESSASFASPFTCATTERPPRQINYTVNLSAPALHTSVFFSKAAKSLELFARLKSAVPHKNNTTSASPVSDTSPTSNSLGRVHNVQPKTLSDRDWDRGSQQETSVTISDSMDVDEAPVSSRPLAGSPNPSELRIERAESLDAVRGPLEQLGNTFELELPREEPKDQDAASGPLERLLSEVTLEVDMPDQNTEASHKQVVKSDGLIKKAVLSSQKLVELLLSKRASKILASSESRSQSAVPVANLNPSDPTISCDVAPDAEVADPVQAPNSQANHLATTFSLEPGAPLGQDVTSLAVFSVDPDSSRVVDCAAPNIKEPGPSLESPTSEPSTSSFTTGMDAALDTRVSTSQGDASGSMPSSGEPGATGSSSSAASETTQVPEDKMPVTVAALQLECTLPAETTNEPLLAETSLHPDAQELQAANHLPRESPVGSATTEESPSPNTPPQKVAAPTHVQAFDITMLDLSQMSLPLLMKGSKYDDDDDDDVMSLSGVELAYPEEVF